jgi:hypothetical protein
MPGRIFSRRAFTALGALPFAPPLARAAETPRKRIAVLVSEYRPSSHADVVCGRLLEGYWFEGRERRPELQIVSMYTDQVPDEDMSRDLAARHGFKLLPSIRHALTLTSDYSTGPRRLAVDGVVVVCEHGAYPYNPQGQKLYPRFEFFKQVVDVFRETGQTAPVFSDKHLSYDWVKARWMYDQARQLNFPLMAGSVLPLARDPARLLPPGAPIDKAVLAWEATFFDSKDSYGFHALERLQSLVERRQGGETGIAAVECLEGPPVWEWTRANPWADRLLNALGPKMRGSGFADSVEDPMLFRLEYRSGLEAAIFRLNGCRMSAGFAALRPGDPQPLVIEDERTSPAVAVPQEHRRRYMHNIFSAEVRLIEQMIATGKEPQPVERTLLTTGALAALFDSSYQPAAQYGRTLQHGTRLKRGRRVETPHLGISYTPA